MDIVCFQLTGTGSNQAITTYDPRLNALGLPQYPPLPSNLDAAKVEEIRRTVYIGNLDPKTVSCSEGSKSLKNPTFEQDLVEVLVAM